MKRTLMVGILAAVATSAWAQARLTTVKHIQAGDSLRIIIEGRGLNEPKVSHNSDGTAWNVAFSGTLSGRAGKTTIGRFGVKDLKWGVMTKNPPTVHVHLTKVPTCHPKIVEIDGIWAIEFERATATPIKPTKMENADDLVAMDIAIRQLEGGIKPVTTAAPETTVPTVPTLPPGFESSNQTLTPVAPLAITGSPVIDTDNRLVSLEFSNTDIVQILRALSLQAGVNVIAAPEVSPADKPVKLSMALNQVSVDDALSFITAMTGTRYGRIANTFVVTPAATFSSSMRSIMERSSSGFQTRVVNISSGAGTEIKSATFSAHPQDGPEGYYDLIVPEGNNASQPAPAAAPQGNPPQTLDQDTQASGANPAAQSAGKSRAYYVMLVGDPDRLDSIEGYVRTIDNRIAASYSLSRTQDLGTSVVPILSGQTARIQSMLEKLLSEHPRSSEYSITESSVKELSEGELPTKVLLMIGPAAELGTLERFARNLDRELCFASGITYSEDFSTQEKVYEVVDLNFLEPIVAEFDLKSRVKGLWVTVLPDPVTPGIKGEDEGEKQETPTEAENKGASTNKTTKIKREIGREPMRLMLHGTRQQISEARQYLAMVDVAPRQVALEIRVVEMSKEDALKLGIDWSILSSGGIVRLRSNQGAGGTSVTPGTISGQFGLTGGDTTNVLAQIDKVAGDRKLIARPNALVSDGRQANLFVGDTVRYIKSINTSQNGTTVITDEIQVGAKFDIRARVGGGGNVALDVMQNFSLLTGFLPVPGGGQLPQTSDRTTNMFVNMQSGETIAIGGLIQDNDRKQVSGIPLLMDLPIIGQLFRRTDNVRNRTEIVFFLTAVEVGKGTRESAARPKGGTLMPDGSGHGHDGDAKSHEKHGEEGDSH
ncbi:MAG: type II secretion system protein GspD [Fimbriimonadaceae bacterium]